MKLSKLPKGEGGSPEIFHTLQGEGRTLGTPSVFLRLSLCNLHCHWCDTPYTWNWENTPWPHQDNTKFKKEEQILELTPQEIAPLIDQHSCPNLVITGGEPLLQQDELTHLIPLLKNITHIEIETNGTQVPSEELDSLVHQYNVSPKLANSGMDEKKRLHPEALTYFKQSQKANFKFVIQDQTDLDELLHLQAQYQIPPSKITLMPEGRDSATLQTRTQWLAQLCLTHGFHLTPRLHVQLWQNQRAK